MDVESATIIAKGLEEISHSINMLGGGMIGIAVFFFLFKNMGGKR